MKSYTAKATREGRWWIIDVPEVDGVTQARRLSEAEKMARELVAVTLDVELDDVAVTVEVESVDDVPVASRLDVIRQRRIEAAKLEREASADAVTLARDLSTHGVPLRDVGAILGVSYQRAHQLVQVTTDS